MATTELLRRDGSDCVIAGVCGGVAKHYRIDPLLVRIAAVILALSSGLGLVLYAAAWLLLPKGTGQAVLTRAFPSLARVQSRTWTLIVSGAALALLVFIGTQVHASLLPTMLVLGILYASQLRPGTKGHPASGSATPRSYAAPTAAPVGAQWPLLAPPPGEVFISTPAGLWRPTNRFGQPLSAVECAAFYAVSDPVGLYTKPAPAVSGRRSRTVAIVSGLAIAAIFAMMSLLGAFVSVPAAIYLAVALVGVGGSLIVGAFVGRPRGFIAIAIVLVLIAGGSRESASAPFDVADPPSIATATPSSTYRTASEMPPAMSVTDDYVLDLSSTQIDKSVAVDIQVSNGDATIILPGNANYIVNWHDSHGSVTMPDGREDPSGTYGRQSIDLSHPTLTLTITVTSGDLVVIE